MKKTIITLIFIISASTMFAQKVAYLNTDTIFKKLPEMQDAQKKLNSFLSQAENEINRMNQDYQKKVAEYQQSKDTLNQFIANQKLQEIQDLNKKIQDFQVQAQSEYLQMQKDLLTPIQDKFNKAVEKVAKQKGYSAVIQITPQIIYYDKKYDITDLVLKEMGVK